MGDSSLFNVSIHFAFLAPLVAGYAVFHHEGHEEGKKQYLIMFVKS